VAALVVGAVVGIGQVASAEPVDIASTHAFIVDSVQFARADVATFGRGEASVDAAINRVVRTCPDVASRSAQNGTAAQQRTWTSLIDEAGYAVVLAEVAPLRPATTKLTRTLGRLRWSVASINRAMAAFLRADRAILALKPPDLCGDARASAATAFTSVPRSAVTFLRSASVAFPDSPATDSGLLRTMNAFVTQDESSEIKELCALNVRLENLNRRFGPTAYDQMIDGLAGKPAS